MVLFLAAPITRVMDCKRQTAMALFQLNSKLSDRELRWFAGVWFPGLCGMAGWLVMKRLHSPAASAGIWGAGAVLSLVGLSSPAVMRPIYLVIMRLTFPI